MFDKFTTRHIGVSRESDLKAMLETIGVGSVEELIAQVIPQSIRLKKPIALPAEGMSEYEYAAHIRSLAEHKYFVLNSKFTRFFFYYIPINYFSRKY